jgi:hypothetical protein
MPWACNSRYTATHPTSPCQNRNHMHCWIFLPREPEEQILAPTRQCPAVFVNAKTVNITHTTLTEMGLPQEAKYLKTDNSTSDGIINKTVQKKFSKAMDMCFYWIQDRVEHGQFDVGWEAGDTNMGDYFTKHHSPTYHKRIRQYYLNRTVTPMIRHNYTLLLLRGCLNICTCTISRPGQGHTITQTRYGHTPIARTDTDTSPAHKSLRCVSEPSGYINTRDRTSTKMQQYRLDTPTKIPIRTR